MTEQTQNWSDIVRRFKTDLKTDGASLFWDMGFLSACQDQDINVTPSTFYSPIPNCVELEEHYRQNNGKQIYNHPSVFNPETIRDYFPKLAVYKDEFYKNDSISNADREEIARVGMFSHSDAMAYYSFVRHLKPKSIVEIGSGYSTMVAKMACGKNDTASAITSFEPYPSELLKAQHDVTLIQKKAQDITAEALNSKLSDGDILFIDSTHTVKEGSDVIHIIARLLPFIEKKVFIHFHDIYLPYVFPKHNVEKMQFWEEQYLLYAFLLDNPKANVLFGSMYNAMNYPEEMAGFSISENIGGGSIWFEYN